ncbi:MULTISPECIES: MFS transporter [Corynebacterium]|uniref:MFS transporter n=1 Tax=Corynebacterium hadale TaxID=2026255 RepID=A0A269PGJ3_9CORY|nr:MULTISPECIES: MFS transporter [Corynebacterium]PAJ71262.1 MFS transporter [Corynebacterium hadale]PAT13981.1 MFS transporter [Corynebacterium sp. NML 120412]WKC59116.1 multidrug efflux system protein MdtL [Corynebacterium hadale]
MGAAAPGTRDNARAPFLLALAFLITAGWSANHFASVLVLLRRDHDISAVLANSAYGIYAVGLFPSLLIGGWVADRFGSRPAVVAGTVIAAAGNVYLMLGIPGHGLLLGRFVVGLGVGLVVSAGTTWAGRLRGAGGSTLAGIALTTGFMLGPVSSGVVAHLAADAVKVPFVVPIVMAVGVMVASIRMRDDGAPTVTKTAETRPGHSEVKALATAVPMGIWVFASITTAMVVLAGRTDFAIGAAFMPGVAAVLGFSVALAVQALARRGQWGPRAGVVGALGATGGMALIAVGGARPSAWVFVAATALLGLAYGLCLREGLLDVDEYTPPEKRGRVIGLYYVATYIGFGISPLIAWITPRVGPSLPFVVLAALAGCSALIRAAQIRRGYLVRGVVGS